MESCYVTGHSDKASDKVTLESHIGREEVNGHLWEEHFQERIVTTGALRTTVLVI